MAYGAVACSNIVMSFKYDDEFSVLFTYSKTIGLLTVNTFLLFLAISCCEILKVKRSALQHLDHISVNTPGVKRHT